MLPVKKGKTVEWLKLTMKQNPDRPRSGSRPPPRPGLGRFAAECAAGEPPRLPTPPSRAGGACALLFLPGGGRSGGGGGGGEEVLGGLWEERLGGRPPKSPGSRSSWNMSTNSCCSSSKVSCTTRTERFDRSGARGTVRPGVSTTREYSGRAAQAQLCLCVLTVGVAWLIMSAISPRKSSIPDSCGSSQSTKNPVSNRISLTKRNRHGAREQ